MKSLYSKVHFTMYGAILAPMVLFLLLHTSLFAKDAEQFPFIGLTLSVDAIDFDDSTDTPSLDKTNFGVRYGKQTIDWRTVFTLSGNNDFQSASIEVDKILLDQIFGMPEFRPYLGATLGYLHYEDISSLGDNGYYYGGNFGFLIYATDTVDIDLSYHYYKVSELDPLDTMRGPSLSIHYFY